MTDAREAPLRAIVDAALPRWHDLTGVHPDQTRFTLGDMDVRDMNDAIEKALNLEESGETACFLLECFLRLYLEDKSFTVASILKDYTKLQGYLERAHELFSLLQSDAATYHLAAFREQVREGLRLYGADTEAAMEVVDHPNALSFLRRDALHSMRSLTPYQFLAGEFSADTRPKLLPHVYQAFSINALLPALRDMPVSGIVLVLVRDPAHADRSFFGFGMRNGDNVVFFTDKTRPAFPGQEDVRRSRGNARDLARRVWSNHFPYQMLHPQWTDKGEMWFEPETLPALHDRDLVPTMPISALEPNQAVWLTMVLALLAERFWQHRWQAPQLAYTGVMITDETVLVERQGVQLPVAKGYQPLGMRDLALPDVSRHIMSEQVSVRPSRTAKRNQGISGGAYTFEIVSGVNQWLEDRYAHTVDPAILNLWAEDDDAVTLLPEPKQAGGKRGTALVAAGPVTLSRREIESSAFWNRPKGYRLQTASAAMFGTREELEKDRVFIGRYNLAMHIQREADTEYEARKAEIAAWYKDRVQTNVITLAAQAALCMPAERRARAGALGVVHVHDVNDRDHSQWLTFPAISLGAYRQERGGFHECYYNGTRATWRALFSPKTAAELAGIAGLRSTDDLPDVLRHWQKDKDYVGNSILQRLDPVETRVHDPWMRANFRVALFLSKRAMNKLVKSPYVVAALNGLPEARP